jgi:hypothetical protein
MKMHTPRTDYFMCSPSGIVLVAPPATPDPFSDAGYPALEDRAWDDGTREKALPEDARACVHPTSGKIEGIVRVYSPCAWIHVYVAVQPVKVVPPGQVGVREVPVSALSTGPVAVGLSVKGTVSSEYVTCVTFPTHGISPAPPTLSQHSRRGPLRCRGRPLRQHIRLRPPLAMQQRASHRRHMAASHLPGRT